MVISGDSSLSKDRVYLKHYYEDITTERFKWIKRDKPSKIRHKKVAEMCKNADGLILDVGCGFGEILSAIKSENNETVGTDISCNTLKIAKTNIDHVIACDTENLPLRGDSVELALCVEVLEHLVNPVRCVYEIHRILKEKGEVIFTTPNPNTPYYTKDKEHLHSLDETTLKKMINKAGFQILSFEILHVKYSIFSRKYEETQILLCRCE